MNTVNKRLNKELESFEPFTYEKTFCIKTRCHNLKCIIDDYYLKFKIPYYYPFKPPTLYVIRGKNNEKEYINTFIDFKIKNTNFIELLERAKKYECPCCYTITCMWSPAYKLKNIINEFLEFEETKKNIFNLFLFHKEKIFIDDIFFLISDYIYKN